MYQFKVSTSITKRSATLDKYLQDINRIKMVTPDEEVMLAQRIKEGDQSAVDRLVLANLRFVVTVAKQYACKGVPLEDLINEGNIGLMRAAQKFDDTYGFKFISYAVWWIRQSILQSISENSRVVRIPVNQLGFISKINKAMLNFEQEHRRMPSTEELAKILDITTDKVEDALSISTGQTSMDAPITSDSESCMLDVLANKDEEPTDYSLNKESLAIELNRCLSQLPDRAQDIVKMYYGIGVEEMSLEEIGTKLDLSRERVRQIKEKAIRHMHKKYHNTLSAYLC